MSAELVEIRCRALNDLIAVQQPLLKVIARVRALPWDSDAELVVLDRSAALAALFLSQSAVLSFEQLELWAETIEGREDIGFELGYEELLSRLIFETANPSLAQAPTDAYVTSWIDRLGTPA